MICQLDFSCLFFIFSKYFLLLYLKSSVCRIFFYNITKVML